MSLPVACRDLEIGQIPNSWDVVSVDDIKANGRSIISGPFGSNISSKFFVKSGIPVIRGNNLSLNVGTKFIDKDFVFITEEKANELGAWASADDLIFTAVGTIGQVGILNTNNKYNKYTISNKQLRLTVDKTKISPLFLYYWFSTSYMQEYIISNNTGSSVPLINLGILKSLPIHLPLIKEQRAIAAVLSSLDDKIDFLHRQNATLEAMAEALFRKWFVVEAKEEWEHGFLPDEFEFVMGQSPNGYSFNEVGMGTPMFQGNADFGFRFPSARIYTTEPTRFAQKFDTLISVRAPVGAQNMAQDRCCIGRGLAAFRYKNNSSFYSYTYFKLRYLLKEILVYNDEGTVFGSISKNDFNNIEIIIPDYNSVSEFENMILSTNNRVISNCQQINTLEKLRDTLLPKLMSGEVRVDF